ncbi:MAG: hypothetical protein JWN44_3979 [Myxococcales bacterium]|nr:hypothetical protein [Myxococcales bacterium]
MDRLTALLLRLTPDERIALSREVAKRVQSSDDDDVVAAWRDVLERRFAEPESQLPLFDGDRRPHG